MNLIFGILVGLIPLSLGLYTFWRSFWLQTKGSKATGTVLEIRPGYKLSRNVSVRFKTQKNELIKVTVEMDWLLSRFYRAGKKVSVLYDPKKPTYATIDSIGVMYPTPILLTAIGLVLIYASWMSKK